MGRGGLTGDEYLESQASLVLAFPVYRPFHARNTASAGPFHGESEQVGLPWLECSRRLLARAGGTGRSGRLGGDPTMT